MAQKEHSSEGTERASPVNLMPGELAAISKKRIDDFVNVQAELLEKFSTSNKHWFERMQSEANLASDLASMLTSARSAPDVMAAYQEWTSRHLEMMAEDGKTLLADTQKGMETGARLLSNGWWSIGKGGGIGT